MDRRTLLKNIGGSVLVVSGALTAPHFVFASPENPSNFGEYCFTVSPHTSVALRGVDTTPEEFLKQDSSIQAAINGAYYGKDNLTQGIAYLAEDWHFATEKKEHTRGYFSVNREGNEIRVGESLEGKIVDYFLVLGTHPLLITEGKVHSQALEKKYDGRKAYRSAIGTKSGKEICFAVSNDEIFMSGWAERLHNRGYIGALNLDGGPISQMAIREEDTQISVKGKGMGNTKLVIFSYTH